MYTSVHWNVSWENGCSSIGQATIIKARIALMWDTALYFLSYKLMPNLIIGVTYTASLSFNHFWTKPPSSPKWLTDLTHLNEMIVWLGTMSNLEDVYYAYTIQLKQFLRLTSNSSKKDQSTLNGTAQRRLTAFQGLKNAFGATLWSSTKRYNGSFFHFNAAKLFESTL